MYEIGEGAYGSTQRLTGASRNSSNAIPSPPTSGRWNGFGDLLIALSNFTQRPEQVKNPPQARLRGCVALL